MDVRIQSIENGFLLTYENVDGEGVHVYGQDIDAIAEILESIETIESDIDDELCDPCDCRKTEECKAEERSTYSYCSCNKTHEDCSNYC